MPETGFNNVVIMLPGGLQGFHEDENDNHDVTNDGQHDSSQISASVNAIENPCSYDFESNYVDYLLKTESSTNVIINSIQDLFTRPVKGTMQSWRGSLPFVCESPERLSLMSRDCLKFVGKNNSLRSDNCKIYFPSSKYSTFNGFKGSGFQKLVRALQLAAIEKGGYQLTKTGTRDYKKEKDGSYRISCF